MMTPMRIVFMGTPDFAVASLDALVKDHYNIVGVVTSPDKPAGRGQRVTVSAVKAFATEKGLRLLQPANMKDPAFIDELRSLRADLQLVVAFRMLPEAVWNMPRLGTYNLHASLLPRLRGAAPINWAIIRGEKETGITTFKLRHEIDTGTILFQEKVAIPERMTAGELHDVLMIRGAALLVKTVQALERSEAGEALVLQTQDDTQATHAPKIFKDDCRINWQRPLADIDCLVRGLSPYPGAFTSIRNGDSPIQNLRLFLVEPLAEAHEHPAGSLTVDAEGRFFVFCPGGRLQILDLQLEGKKRMKADDFLRGYKLQPGALLA